MAALFFVGIFILAFGLVSAKLEKGIITPPMVFVAAGIVAGPAFLGILDLEVESPIVHMLAEATLVLVLFTDAARIDLSLLRRDFGLPVRMLSVGLPLTILAGMGVAIAIFPEFSIWEAAILATILAPTDAALGQAVVSAKAVPVRIRQALNVESGLNDGIALPILMLFIALANVEASPEPASYWITYALLQLVLGPAVGVATGFLGGRILHWGTRVGLVNHIFQQLASLALALVAFAGAEAVGGNGFIAAFAAGLTLGNTARGICTCLYEFAEAEGQLLALLAFLTFGAADVFPGAWNLGIPVVLYAVLSLTLVRMAPVSVSLVGSGLAPVSHGFLGWFGPRGLASILYVFLILEELQTPATDTIFQVVIVTVLLSVFAHGLSASPGAAAYAARINKAIARKPSHVEAQPVGEHPLRINPRHR